MEKQFIVYKHTSPDGKIYIGMTSKTLEERSGKNGHNYKKNKEFYADIQKYGWDNFQHEILEENLTLDEARERECYYIKEFDTQNTDFGYNTSAGGEYCKPTEEANKKISEAHKGKQLSEEHKHKISESKLGENNPMFGKHHKDEAKRKISEARKGKFAGENHPFYGKHQTDEARQKISETHKGRYWYNNGDIELRAFECPGGFTPGRLKRA